MSKIAMPRRIRQTVATIHVVSSVGLLGSAASVGVLAAAGEAAAVPTLVHTLGIPLALLGLITGVLLGLGTRWGLFRHGWVTAKLMLLLTVLLIGVVGVRPAIDGMRAGDGRALTTVMVLNAVQLTALLAATLLSVTKPHAPPRFHRPAPQHTTSRQPTIPQTTTPQTTTPQTTTSQTTTPQTTTSQTTTPQTTTRQGAR